MRRRLKTVSDVDEVMLDTCKAATGNERSPMVEWHIGSTTSVKVDADLRRRQCLNAIEIVPERILVLLNCSRTEQCHFGPASEHFLFRSRTMHDTENIR